MHVREFGLERWFGEHEHGADIMLAESGVRSLDSGDFDTDPGELGYVIPTDGDPAFRADIGARYGLGAEAVCLTCGAQEANFLAFLSLLGGADGEPGEGHAVVVTPTYEALHAVPETFASVTRVPLEPPEWELDVDRVADAVRPETDVVVVVNPNNPTGRLHTESELRALYDLAADADAYLLGDEVYRMLAPDPAPAVASLGPRGVSTASLSKAYGLAGLRLGWLAGPPEVVERAVRWKDYTTISPSAFGQHVAKQALADEETIVGESRELAADHREVVAAFLEEYGLDWYEPVGVNGFVTVPDGFADGRAFCTAVVEEERVVLAPGDVFGHPDRFRIGFGLPRPELVEGLERVGRVIERRRA